MYPHERSLVKQLTGKRFVLLGVNSDQDKEALKQVIEQEGITWRSFWNGPDGTNGPIAKAWNIHAWPTLYLLDAEGRIRFKRFADDATLDKCIGTLLAEIGEAWVARADD